MFGELGRAPVKGDTVTYGSCRFTVQEVDGARIRMLDVTFGGHVDELERDARGEAEADDERPGGPAPADAPAERR